MVQSEYISVDPYMRWWMRNSKVRATSSILVDLRVRGCWLTQPGNIRSSSLAIRNTDTMSLSSSQARTLPFRLVLTCRACYLGPVTTSFQQRTPRHCALSTPRWHHYLPLLEYWACQVPAACAYVWLV